MTVPSTGRAIFTPHPRTAEELKGPYQANAIELDYQILKVIRLDRINYENFITDMVVSRSFLEENMDGCGIGSIAKCLLVLCKGLSTGILVVPEYEGFIEYAAIYK